MLRKQFLVQASKDFDWHGYLLTHYTVKQAGEELRICCMNCGETKYKLYVNPEKGVFQCKKCSFHTGHTYNITDFISLTEGITKAAAAVRLAELCRSVAPTEEEIRMRAMGEVEDNAASTQSELAPITLPAGLKKLVPGEGQKFWDYLLGRGLTEREVLAGNVHYTPLQTLPIFSKVGKLKGDLAGRVIWPVYGRQHDIVSYQARVISTDTSPVKYLAAPDSDLSKTLWPYVPPKEGKAYLVEGILDAYAGHREKKSFYSCFGKKISSGQISLLKAWGTTEVTVFFDKKDAMREMLAAVEQLKMHFDKVYVLDNNSWASHIDPGECLRLENGSALMQEAINHPVDVYSSGYVKWKCRLAA